MRKKNHAEEMPGQNQRPEAAAEPKGESTGAVIAAIVANIAIGVVKFIASFISGSTAMFSEGVHSIVDSGDGLLVLLGIHRAKKPASFAHPFGYGKELYFWTLVVSILIFALGGGVSMWEGIRALGEVGPDTKLDDPTMAYIVLVISMIIEGISLSVGLKQFNAARGSKGAVRFIKEAKDPSLFTVVLEDTAAELGLVLAFLGLFFGHLLNNPYLDGIAAIAIGVLLAAVAIVLLHETKGLLIGEGLNRDELDEVRQLVEADESVVRCGRILSMYMGPDSLVITIDANFDPAKTADDVFASIDRIETHIKERFPQTKSVFVEAENLKTVTAQQDAFKVMGEGASKAEIGEAKKRFFSGS